MTVTQRSFDGSRKTDHAILPRRNASRGRDAPSPFVKVDVQKRMHGVGEHAIPDGSLDNGLTSGSGHGPGEGPSIPGMEQPQPAPVFPPPAAATQPSVPQDGQGRTPDGETAAGQSQPLGQPSPTTAVPSESSPDQKTTSAKPNPTTQQQSHKPNATKVSEKPDDTTQKSETVSDPPPRSAERTSTMNQKTQSRDGNDSSQTTGTQSSHLITTTDENGQQVSSSVSEGAKAKPKAGLIAGSVIAALVGIALLASILFFLFRRRRLRTRSRQPEYVFISEDEGKLLPPSSHDETGGPDCSPPVVINRSLSTQSTCSSTPSTYSDLTTPVSDLGTIISGTAYSSRNVYDAYPSLEGEGRYNAPPLSRSSSVASGAAGSQGIGPWTNFGSPQPAAIGTALEMIAEEERSSTPNLLGNAYLNPAPTLAETFSSSRESLHIGTAVAALYKGTNATHVEDNSASTSLGSPALRSGQQRSSFTSEATEVSGNNDSPWSSGVSFTSSATSTTAGVQHDDHDLLHGYLPGYVRSYVPNDVQTTPTAVARVEVKHPPQPLSADAITDALSPFADV